MEYIRRVLDDVIDRKAEAFNAISITGPKGCGKTRTAKERCKTVIEFQDEDKRDGYIAVAETAPRLFLKNPGPILFDEWQDAPKIWGTIRKACDDNPESVGEYYLTGSTSKKINYDIDGMISGCDLESLFFAACRGGWPRCMALKKDMAKLEIAKDYYKQIYRKDISAIDGINRNPEWTRALLWSYARNMATTAKKKNIFADVKATQNVTDATLFSYEDALENLFVVRDIDAWTPHLRSKSAIRSAKKHIFVDPSIGLAALGIGPDYFINDLDLFGHVFENMVLRDLLVYAEKHNARILHYTDNMGVEADAVYQMADGRYALIEIKTGMNKIPEAEKSLLRFNDVIENYNDRALQNEAHPRDIYRKPSALIVICANANMAYTTDSGLKIVPIGCLKD